MQKQTNNTNRRSLKGAPANLVTKSQVRQMIKSAVDSDDELKWFREESTASISTAVAVNSYTPVPQGQTAVSRIGIDVQPVSFDLRMIWLGSADSTNLVRATVFQWHSDDTVDVPTAAKLYDQSILGASLSVVENFNIPSEDKYTILYDKILSLVNGPSSESLQIILDKKILKKLRPMKFIGATTGTNMIYIALSSDSGAIPHPTITLLTTLRFRDA